MARTQVLGTFLVKQEPLLGLDRKGWRGEWLKVKLNRQLFFFLPPTIFCGKKIYHQAIDTVRIYEKIDEIFHYHENELHNLFNKDVACILPSKLENSNFS